MINAINTYEIGSYGDSRVNSFFTLMIGGRDRMTAKPTQPFHDTAYTICKVSAVQETL
jgi:hypothetical protein